MERERVVLPIAGSESDDAQIAEGLQFLLQAKEVGEIKLFDFCGRPMPGISKKEICPDAHLVSSAHRNSGTLDVILNIIAMTAQEHPDTDYFVVTAAGMLAVLPSVAAGYIYNTQGVPNGNTFIIGAGLEYHPDEKRDIFHATGSTARGLFKKLSPQMRNDLAAILSLTQAPGCLAICENEKGLFFGKEGFTEACQFAINGLIPDELREKIMAAPKKNKNPSCRAIVKILEASGAAAKS